jgi:hypothetical protein
VCAQVPDLIIINARVFTADLSHPAAEAVVIEGTRIAFVGTSADAARLAGADTRIVDAGGRLVTPGLIEAHGHAGLGLGGSLLLMPGLPWPGPNAEQALAIVGAAAKETRYLLVGEVGPLVINDSRDWRMALDLVAPEASSPRALKAVRAVLPATVPVFPVGGIDAASMASWRAAGASGFGVGGSLYQPGRTAEDVRERANASPDGTLLNAFQIVTAGNNFLKQPEL